jgi:iron complex transport system ATP-binding protein
MDMLRAEAAGGALVIAVLHDLTLAARYCDRLLLIDDGRIIADGPPAEVLTAERLRAVYGIDAAIETGGEWPTITLFGRAR